MISYFIDQLYMAWIFGSTGVLSCAWVPLLHNTMISVENFYWVLFHNLLDPVDLDCWYYYPFGTKNHLSLAGEFKPWTPRRENHVLFHFDQEPIWDDNLGTAYDSPSLTWSNRIIKILANSEISEIKKNICRERGMLDWYYFYHGFASLDWFRDSQYMGEQCEVRNAFLSLNHLVRHKRSYRMSLTARFQALEILHKGTVSFHGSQKDCLDEIQDPWTQISQHSQQLVLQNLCNNLQLPIIADSVDIGGAASAGLGHREYELWQRSLWHVVNETVFYDPKHHLTEKIFKPIVCQRPFVLVASPGNLAYLRSYGFKTFDTWIDETYDTVKDHDLRLDMIAREISKFCGMTVHQLRDLHREMLPTLEFNKRHFFGEFRRMITNELVENFDTCIRIWNNGRVDDRSCARHPDLGSAKQTLLR